LDIPVFDSELEGMLRVESWCYEGKTVELGVVNDKDRVRTFVI